MRHTPRICRRDFRTRDWRQPRRAWDCLHFRRNVCNVRRLIALSSTFLHERRESEYYVMKRTIAFMVACLMSAWAFSGTARAQGAVEERRLQELLRPFYLEQAGRYEFMLEGTKLELVRTPVMSWTGQETGFSSGDIFVWMRNGRAEVIGCIGSLARPDDDSRFVFHEFHALTLKPLRPLQVANQEWAPESPGVDLQVIADAPEPAERASQRLLQMRSLARDFSARMTAPAGSKERLRMLPQPICRNEPPEGDRTDGALFAYVWAVGTDPELLLLLESLPTDEGYRWHYAPVRFTYRPIALDHRGKEVWQVGIHHSDQLPRAPYVTRGSGITTIDELEDYAARASVSEPHPP